MSTKMFKIITLFMLLAMLVIPLSTVLAVATDIAGVSSSVAENSTAAGTAVASGGIGPYTYGLSCGLGGVDDGLFSITVGGVLTFSPAPDFEIPTDNDGDNVYNICVQAIDSDLSTYDENFAINVTDVDEGPPVITWGGTTPEIMDEDGAPTPWPGVVGDLVANDPDTGQTLTWSVSTLATNGLATISGGTVSPSSPAVYTYAPFANYNGADTFTVQVTDGTTPVTQVVNVTINAINDAPVITFTGGTPYVMDEDGSPTAWPGVVGDLSAADVDTGNTLTWTVSAAATNGTATVNGAGGVFPLNPTTFTYAPFANYNGVDSFTVQVSDGALTDTQVVNVTVNAINDVPVITFGGANPEIMSEDGAPIAWPGALGDLSATDVDTGDTLTWSVYVAATNGTATIVDVGGASPHTPTTTYNYAPTANYNGADTFTVQVTDGTTPVFQVVNVTINAVNDAPVITFSGTDPYVMNEDGALIAWPGLPAHLSATDVDAGATLTWSVSAVATNGTATITDAGGASPHTPTVFTYAPTAGYNGTDAFTVRVSDGLLTATRIIYVTITPDRSLSGTVSFTGCALKLGGGLVANFGAFTGAVNFVDGQYTINDIPNGTTGTVTITQPSNGYTITWDTGSTLAAYPGGVTADASGIDFDAVGTRTITGTFTGPAAYGSPRVPDDAAGGATVTLNANNCLTFAVPANGGGATTAFTVSNVPPKAFVLRPVYDEGGLAANPIAAFSPANLYANTTYSNVAGKAFTFTWNSFTIGGSAKNSFVPPANLSGATTVTLVGTGVFDGTNITGIANTTGTWSAFSPFRKPFSGDNDPQPYAANINFANLKYQDFVLGTGGIQTFDNNKTNNVTAYGAAAIYGPFGGYTVPEETVVNFGGGLSSNIEDAGQFLLSYLEPKSYTLAPTATGIYFTNSSILYAQASQAIAATALGTDATGKFYAWKLPTPLTPANNAVLPLANPKSPTFTWTAVPGATGYDIQVSTVATFPAGVNTKTVSLGAVTTYTPGGGDIYNLITSGVKFYWGVKANGAGAGTGEYTHKFPAFQRALTTNNLAPTAQTFTFAGTAATFTWTAPANVPAGSVYKVEYGKTATFPGTVTIIYDAASPANATIPVNTTPVTYSYRVTLVNAAHVAISPVSNVIVSATH